MIVFIVDIFIVIIILMEIITVAIIVIQGDTVILDQTEKSRGIWISPGSASLCFHRRSPPIRFL